jgi:hypothetical protein
MGTCRFLFENLVSEAGQVAVSSARPGLVGLPAPRTQGTATAYAAGQHTGPVDQVFLLEIDSVAAGYSVGQATFRWRRGSASSWEASGVATAEAFLELADGVRVKWLSGPGQDFHLGDAWTIMATRSFGAAALLDADRDTQWEATGAADESLTVDLGESRAVEAVILADHNLTSAAVATLMADDAADWAAPAQSWSLAVDGPHLAAFPAASARHWRLELADPAHPGGALSAGLLYLGGLFQPSRTFRVGFQRSLVAGRVVNATDSGKLTGSARNLAESLGLSFRGLTAADVARFREMYAAVHQTETGRLTPLIFLPYGEDDLHDVVICLPAATLSPACQHQAAAGGGYYSLSLSLEEVVRSHA